MTATLTVEGIPELQAALRRASAEARQEVAKAIAATGINLQADVIKRIQRGPKTGRVYTEIFRMIGGRPVPIGPRQGNNLSPSHQASAPGQSPATDTGRLASSITFARTGPLSVTVGSNVVYAALLEFGTSNIEPRPAWVPAIEAARPKYRARLEKALGDAFK